MSENTRGREFASAAAVLPEAIRRRALLLPCEEQERAEEFRLRVGRPAGVCIAGEERPMGQGPPVTQEDLACLVERVTGASVHSRLHELQNGFLSVAGGHRLGVCGTGTVKNGELTSMRMISSVNLRIARAWIGAADGIPQKLWKENGIQSALILSPPGAGKTTLLRDLVRQLSDGCAAEGRHALRVGLADERGELAACRGGKPGFDIGIQTDVMVGVPKARAIEMLLRTMSPQVIAVDEITGEADVRAMEQAVYCGVSLIATAHAFDCEDFLRRPVYTLLRRCGVFSRAIELERRGERRKWTIKKMEETADA